MTIGVVAKDIRGQSGNWLSKSTLKNYLLTTMIS